MKVTVLLLATMMASALSVQCQQKRPFELWITPEQKIIKAGEPVLIDVVKTNNSAHSMNLSPTNNPAEYYDMKVRLEGVKVEETADLQKLKKQDGHRVTSFMLDQLKPGKSMKETVEMSAYHGMTQPGIYTICFHQSTVSSNIAIVTVTR